MAFRRARKADTDTSTTTEATTGEDKPASSTSTKTAKAPKTSKASTSSSKTERAKQAGSAVRVRIAQVVWLAFVVCALFLTIGALLIALDANAKNTLVEFVLNGADVVDLDIFSRKNGIKDFGGSNADVKNALFNWGIGAVAYLIVGRILAGIIRP